MYRRNSLHLYRALVSIRPSPLETPATDSERNCLPIFAGSGPQVHADIHTKQQELVEAKTESRRISLLEYPGRSDTVIDVSDIEEPHCSESPEQRDPQFLVSHDQGITRFQCGLVRGERPQRRRTARP